MVASFRNDMRRFGKSKLRRSYDFGEMSDRFCRVTGYFGSCHLVRTNACARPRHVRRRSQAVLAAISVWRGRHVDAGELFDKLLALRNDVGLLAEEYDPGIARLLGNFPQAFSHFALVDAALRLLTVPARHG